MNNKRKVSGSEGLNGKLAYESPKAMRLGDMRNGGANGTSCSPGSGFSGVCSTGSGASACGPGSSGIPL